MVFPLFLFSEKFLEEFLIGSELKSIEKLCDRAFIFPPGCCARIPITPRITNIDIHRYYVIPSLADRIIPMNITQVNFEKQLNVFPVIY